MTLNDLRGHTCIVVALSFSFLCRYFHRFSSSLWFVCICHWGRRIDA